MYIYSTLSADVVYTTLAGDILIHGGANIPDKHLLTPYGKMTKISDDQYAALKDHEVFKTHVANGFIRADKHKEDAEKVASDMTGRDESAPDTEESLMAGDPEIEEVKDGVIKRKAK